MDKQFEQLKNDVLKLTERIDKLSNATTIPFDVEGAFVKRLDLKAVTRVSVSSKSASSENQSVNEAGAAAYSVMKSPDGFLQVSVSGTTYYLPYFT